ncbi:GDSL-type esterase/lipase family protein [Desertibacillus haloalkaliphilus]|uniref:GDSL-type esterase/lipase family protein n=1 Tax=Desertibacillus haloalkaliphilus TaxID=1328930 RepID=UPI001C2756C0|nr:GDSL-type esterase/lipase family protein [Desertibacillus haloalkaliphilus]MBU8905331.1 spore gernimation protein [Desertibacillus haloalkaliphilus]
MHVTYTALGDSLTTGVGAFFSLGFVKRYARMLEHLYHVPVAVKSKGKAGLTSAELLARLRRIDTRNAIAEADLITITIGGNDLLQAYRRGYHLHALEHSVNQFAVNLQLILAEIKAIKALSPKKSYRIQLIGLYNPFPKHPYSDYFIHKYNNILKSYHSNLINYVDIYPLFEQNHAYLLSFDYHPNSKGYQVIAEQALATLQGYR